MVRKEGVRRRKTRGKEKERRGEVLLAGAHQMKWIGGQKSSFGGKGMRERMGKNTGGERSA